VIHETGSPDVRYALAWGYDHPVDWEQFKQEDGTFAGDPDDQQIANYVVNVRTGAVLGRTGSAHFGDRSSYNHLSISSSWGSDPLFLAAISNAKWNTLTASVHQIIRNGDKERLSPSLELLEPAKSAVLAHLKQQGHPALKKFTEDQFTWTLHDVRFNPQEMGTAISIGVIGQVPKNDDEHASFDAAAEIVLNSAVGGQAPKLGKVLSVYLTNP